MNVLSYDAFIEGLAVSLGVEPSSPRDQYATVFDDWALDSLQAFQMIVTIEVMADSLMPPAELPEIFTCGDAFAYYLDLVDSGREP